MAGPDRPQPWRRALALFVIEFRGTSGRLAVDEPIRRPARRLPHFINEHSLCGADGHKRDPRRSPLSPSRRKSGKDVEGAHRAGRIAKIGVCWQGASKFGAELGKSFKCHKFEPISKIPKVRLISLQKNAGCEEIFELPRGMRVETLGKGFDFGPDGFLDTAAVTQAMDLIITPDTSIAHLAGALGRPVWVVLKRAPDWRWMLDRSDSPWYPTMTLYRQTSRGIWDDVFRRMADALICRISLNLTESHSLTTLSPTPMPAFVASGSGTL